MPRPFRLPLRLSSALGAGVRGLLFLKPPGADRLASWPLWLALVAGQALSMSLDKAWQIGLAGEFDAAGLPGAVYPSMVLLLVAGTTGWLTGRRDRVLPAAVALSAQLLLLTLLLFPLGLVAREWPTLGRIWTRHPEWWVVWYGLAAAATVVRLMRPMRRITGAIVSAAMVPVLIWTLYGVGFDASMWSRPYVADSVAAARRTALGRQDVLYSQPALLDAALADLRPQRPGKVDLYYLGVGGYASQDVFMKETSFVQSMFDERYGTRGRSLTLVNNAATVNKQPLANTVSIERALLRIGQLIDRDEDIVFLFMTSHGSRREGLAFEASPLRFDPLPPARLREMLDHAGIRNRIIVVSACYSGTFVDALKDDHTLVISAAAADRTSFGCSSENDFTYFGEAYFEQGLRDTDAFIEAFDRARDSVSRRERDEGITPSLPQMAAGEAMREKLASWRIQRERVETVARQR